MDSSTNSIGFVKAHSAQRQPRKSLGLLLCASVLLAGIALAQVDFSLMREVALTRYGTTTAELVDEWQNEVEQMKILGVEEKLQRTNNFFNTRIQWMSDADAFQQNDYWATPLELMGNLKGDCEDFAIAKYATLILAGVDVNKLRITYVKAQIFENGTARNQAHMVLAYYATPDSEPVVLDNLVPDIQAASQRTDLTPVYGFNSKGIWIGGGAKPASNQPRAKLSRWRDLLQRAAEEGLG